MDGENNKRDDVADWRHDGNASLPEMHMDLSVGEGCDGISCKGREEDEGDDGVAKFVVSL